MHGSLKKLRSPVGGIFLAFASPGNNALFVANAFPLGGIDPTLPLFARLFVVAIFLDIGKNSGTLAGFAETSQRSFESLVLAYDNTIHPFSPRFFDREKSFINIRYAATKDTY